MATKTAKRAERCGGGCWNDTRGKCSVCGRSLCASCAVRRGIFRACPKAACVHRAEDWNEARATAKKGTR